MEFEVETRDNPVVTVSLDAGERIGARPGTLVTRSDSVRIATRADESSSGGVTGMIRDAIGDDTDVLRNVFEATAPGHVTLAPDYPGDVTAVDLGATGAVDARVDGILAWTAVVDEDYASDAPADIFSTDDATLRKLAGGHLFLAAFGGLRRHEVSRGDPVLVDEDHLLAWTATLDVSRTQDSRIKSSLVGDSGFLVRFEGEGTVWIQTRDPHLLFRATD